MTQQEKQDTYWWALFIMKSISGDITGWGAIPRYASYYWSGVQRPKKCIAGLTEQRCKELCATWYLFEEMEGVPDDIEDIEVRHEIERTLMEVLLTSKDI